MSEFEKNRIVDEVKEAAPFFEISLKLSVFGHVIFEWVFPPAKRKKND